MRGALTHEILDLIHSGAGIPLHLSLKSHDDFARERHGYVPSPQGIASAGGLGRGWSGRLDENEIIRCAGCVYQLGRGWDARVHIAPKEGEPRAAGEGALFGGGSG
jgi:hypothetical protein